MIQHLQCPLSSIGWVRIYEKTTLVPSTGDVNSLNRDKVSLNAVKLNQFLERFESEAIVETLC